MIKSGARLRSQVCETQLIVIKATDSLDDIRCGGQPMIPVGDQPQPGMMPDRQLAAGVVIGKRYIDPTGAEVLVTKAGTGTLSIGGTPMTVKDAKPLPASD